MHLTLAERLDRKLDKSGECWVWTAHKNSHGYGQIGVDGKTQQAHRVAWSLVNGPIPDGLFVLHACDNRPCCNPAHLHLGTAADNAHECIERGRATYMYVMGEKCSASKLTRAQVLEIRARHAAGGISYPELAQDYIVGRTQIGHIITRKSWPHI